MINRKLDLVNETETENKCNDLLNIVIIII